jgi:WD40 repeat protein
VTDRTSIASVAERMRPLAVGAPVVDVKFLRATAVFVLGEQSLLFAGKDGAERRVDVHAGAILAAACDSTHLVTGGDDGRVVATESSGKTIVLATDSRHRWIDRIALGPDGAVAWSAGKQAFVRNRSGIEGVLELPSTVGGLAFFPKGFRLAIAHYNGATLWFPNAKAEPERLLWKGSHLAVAVSPDGRFVVTAMQEAALHGWRLPDRKDMRMQGYSVRVRSLAWSADAKWLATSGSTQLVLWPFQSKDGPMGKTPHLLAPADNEVTVVASHPKQGIVAAGYADGRVLLVRIEDGAEILARPGGTASISAIGWSSDGTLLAVGTEDGEAGIFDLA